MGDTKSLKRRRKGRQVWVGGAITVVFVLMALFAPWITARHPHDMDSAERFNPPSSEWWFGTDNYGRDMFSRVVYGARISLGIGLVSIVAATLVGAALGLIGGYFRGKIDWFIMRLMDLLFSIPAILLALILVGILGPSLTNLAIAISIVRIPLFARVTRGETLALSERAFVESARSAGATTLRILARHLAPNVLPVLLVQMTINLAFAILAEASLSYLGLGTQPPVPSWGRMVSDGRIYLRQAPWLSAFPGAALMLVIVGFNLLGDGLRDILDPRLR